MSKSLIDPSVKAPTQAPGQYSGFTLQTVRALTRLLEAPKDAVVTVEDIDDVSVLYSDGQMIAEQDTTSIDGNPVSNRAEKLWKTFSNWIDSICSGKINLTKTKFVLYVEQDLNGPIINCFHDVCTDEDADNAIEIARSEFSATPPASSMETFVNNCLNVRPYIMIEILKRFEFINGKGDRMVQPRQLIENTLISESLVEVFLEKSLGWVQKIIDPQVKEKKTISISRSDFRKMQLAFAQRFDRLGFLPRLMEDLPQDLLDQIRAQNPLYIRQLDILGEDEEEKMSAVSDHLTAERIRTMWAQQYEIDEESFEELIDDMKRFWKDTKKSVENDMADKDAERRGRSLYYQCKRTVFDLQGVKVRSSVVTGSYHELANDQKLTLGWHPDFKAKLMPEE